MYLWSEKGIFSQLLRAQSSMLPSSSSWKFLGIHKVSEFMILQSPLLGVYYVLTSAPYSAAYEFIVCFPNVMFPVILFTFSNANVFT